MPSRAKVSGPSVAERLLQEQAARFRGQCLCQSLGWGGAGPAFSSCCCYLILGTFLQLRNSISSWFHMIFGYGSEEERKCCIVSFTFRERTWKSLGSTFVKALPPGSCFRRLTTAGRESCGAGSWFWSWERPEQICVSSGVMKLHYFISQMRDVPNIGTA